MTVYDFPVFCMVVNPGYSSATTEAWVKTQFRPPNLRQADQIFGYNIGLFYANSAIEMLSSFKLE